MFKRLVLTGAAGRLGSYLREPLSKLADELVSSDLTDDFGMLYPNERYISADLTDKAAIHDLLEGADMVIHFGARSDEAPFEAILGPNIIGAYNIWEGAHNQGVKRVVYASSIHVVGMYPRAEHIGTDVPHRADTFYGLAKCFAEDLGRMYWEKRGLESVHLRILSCAQVTSARALGTWLSYDDLIQLVTRAVDTPAVGFTVVYGVSNNDRAPVDNANASFLGYRPKDNAEVFAAKVLANAPAPNTKDAGQMCHGGPFALVALGNSGMAMMNIVNDAKKI